MSPEEKTALTDIAGSLGELRGEMKGMAAAQHVTNGEIHRLRVNLEAVGASEQTSNQRLTSLEEKCRRAHINDTDEHERAAGIAARVELAEQRLNDLEPRFDETEVSIVEVQTGEKTRKEQRETMWRRAAQIVAIATSGGLVSWLAQYLVGCC